MIKHPAMMPTHTALARDFAARLGVIVLAGGHGRRMGGADKASLRVHGTRLVDRLLAQLPYGCARIVVSPHWLGMPQVVENPLFGGPVAGIAAGLAALPPRELVAVMAVDAPDSPRLIPHLVDALDRERADVSVTVESTGTHIQPLCAVWEAGALEGGIGKLKSPRGASARRLLRTAGAIAYVPGTGAERDYDTPGELAGFAAAAEDIAK